jgi:hypothetical protein
VFLRDRPHQRQPRWLKALCGRFWIVIQNYFQTYNLATAAQAAHVWARVRHRLASSTVHRVPQRNAADALLSGKFEEFRHHGFSLFLYRSSSSASKVRSASVHWRILKRPNATASMIISLCPTQKISVSVNQPELIQRVLFTAGVDRRGTPLASRIPLARNVGLG